MLNIKAFETISLSEMDKVKLMNRIDIKYWFTIADLQLILDSIEQDYYVLKIAGETQMPYSTLYFDTPNNEMFTKHHNGKLNRFKIRKRNYQVSGIGFLEIKFKNNKGRTIKKRIRTNDFNEHFSRNEHNFIESVSPYNAIELQKSLLNNFTRLTLVNKNFKERCTIDMDLRFINENKKINMNKLVVLEIKTDGHSNSSALSLALRNHRLKASGFSKYCMGKSLIDENVKRNAFKAKIRSLEKAITIN